MPFTWDDEHIPSTAYTMVNQLSKCEIGGIGKLTYHLYKFSEYDHDEDNGVWYSYPYSNNPDNTEFINKASLKGRDILLSLINLASDIDNLENKTPYTEQIDTWCKSNAHPYDIDELHQLYLSKEIRYNTHPTKVKQLLNFEYQEFMSDLGKLYTCFKFYFALKQDTLGNSEYAYNLYKEGKYFTQFPFFESLKKMKPKFKWKKGITEEQKQEYNNLDLLSAMQRESEFIDVIQDEPIPGQFYDYPSDDYKKMISYFIEAAPKFNLQFALVPNTEKLTLVANVNSVFDIAWYTLARIIIDDGSLNDLIQDGPNKAYKLEDSIFAYCKICGKPFIKRNNRQQYCGSEECNKIRLKYNTRNFRAKHNRQQR